MNRILEIPPEKLTPEQTTVFNQLVAGRGRILEVEPTSLHQRAPVILGSREEVERIERYHHDHDTGVEPPHAPPLFHERSLYMTRS